MNIQTISQVLEQMPGILLAIVYGSAARERLTDRSDIDIAVAGNTAITYERMTEIANILGERAGKEIDLVDLRQVSGPILLEILDKGLVILKKSVPLYAEILRKLWYNQADMMPYTNMIMQKQLDRFFHE